MTRYDVAVIGAGVTGCAIARVLSRYRLNVILVEAAEDVAMGASKANSAIVHAGYDCEPGTLMAKLNVIGNEMYSRWCDELEVELRRVGSLVIAITEEEKASLEKLMEKGKKNGVPELRLISGDEARSLEGTLNPDVCLALYAKTAAITCPYQFTIAAYENARSNGVEALFDAPVREINKEGGDFIVHAGGREFRARRIVNAAGIYADKIARLIGDESFSISPRKGEYILLDRTAANVGKVIFQPPSSLGKGVLVAPTVDGNAFAGPTAVESDDKEDTSVSEEAAETLTAMSKRSVPSLNLRAVITSFAGIRSVSDNHNHDFIIRPSDADKRFIHAAGICSPGLTCAPAIAEMVASLLKESGLPLEEKPDYSPKRAAIRAFRHMPVDERKRAILEQPLYGRVLCRCETVTEAEVLEAIRRGARTLDAVKRRVRAGMGRCQGGFCSPRVMELLANAQGGMDKVTKFGGNSFMVYSMNEGEAARDES